MRVREGQPEPGRTGTARPLDRARWPLGGNMAALSLEPLLPCISGRGTRPALPAPAVAPGRGNRGRGERRRSVAAAPHARPRAIN